MSSIIFEIFDPKADVDIRQGCHLPHWFQAGVTCFVTFRTKDSIPAELARSWYGRRDQWLEQHGVDSNSASWKSAFRLLDESMQREFHERFSQQFLDYLDRGIGECQLQRPEIALIVADSLQHFDGSRYELGDFVVMPNHVHLLVCPLGENTIEDLCYSWKKFTAGKINRLLGRTGHFWQSESFDHLVRSADQLEAIQRYIAENPAKASLSNGNYLYYQRAK
ncbi:MAG: transposase [Pirellulaceae bacterium]